jgi:aminoglycoside phosphotransferase (APT) family kinase protein
MDGRDRARREWNALRALAGRGVAPSAVSVEETDRLGVVAMSWHDGRSATSLKDPEMREAFVRALRSAHETDTTNLGPAVLGVSPSQVVTYMRDVLGADDELLARARRIARRIPEGRRTLIHVDGNIANFMRCGYGDVLLDWESAGYGDPAFDIADACVAPDAFDLSPSEIELLIEAYDPAMAATVHAWIDLLNHWWIARQRKQLGSPRAQLPGTVERSRSDVARQLAEFERRVTQS